MSIIKCFLDNVVNSWIRVDNKCGDMLWEVWNKWGECNKGSVWFIESFDKFINSWKGVWVVVVNLGYCGICKCEIR